MIHHVTTRVAGVSFERRQEVLTALRLDNVEICPEPRNPYDSNALAVWAVTDGGERVQVGYVPRALAAAIAPCVQGQRCLPGAIIGWQGGGDLYTGITIGFDYNDGN